MSSDTILMLKKKVNEKMKNDSEFMDGKDDNTLLAFKVACNHLEGLI